VSLIAELKRRNVIRMAGLYLVGAWLVVQVAATLLPVFEAPAWVMKALVGLLALGLFPALVFSWVFELTPEGLKRDTDALPEASNASQTAQRPLSADHGLRGTRTPAQRMDRMIIVGLSLALLYFGVDKLVLGPQRVATHVAGSQQALVAVPAMPAIDAKSIAVLPFVNMSEDAENEFFSDGLSEEILNSLARIDGLQVVGRTSSFQFKGKNTDLREIGARLGVANVLEGSVRRASDRARITAQLVRVADGFHLWSESYDRTLTDVLAVQLDIAEKVAGAMDVLLDDTQRAQMHERGVKNVEAFIAFQKGMALSEEGHGPGVNMLETLGRADQEFARAVAIEPQLALAHHARTDLQGHILLADSPTAEQRDAALATVRHELELAVRMVRHPLHRLHIEIDRQLYSDDWQGLAARVEALRTAPGCHSDSWFNATFAFGVAEAMLADAERRIACDPLASDSYLYPASAALWAGRPERAIDLVTAAEAAVGAGLRTTELKVRALVMLGRLDEARALLAPMDTLEARVARLHVLLGAASGDDAAAIRARWAGFTRTDLVPEQWVVGDLEVQALTGDRAAANRWAATMDSRPAGSMRLASTLSYCMCGAPFDLEATPNFKARLAESGLKWPPPTLFNAGAMARNSAP